MFDLIDKAIGDLVRRQRAALGLTQAQLADSLDVPLQLIQDAERGVQKVAGSLLIRIAALALHDPDPDLAAARPPTADAAGDAVASALVDDFSSIRSPRVRRALLALLQPDGGGGGHGPPSPMAGGASVELGAWG